MKRDYVTEAAPVAQRPKVPVLRDQLSVWEDEQFPGVECDPGEDRCRQEFKEEADLEFQVRRFGAGLPFQTGSVDYTLDLTKAFDLVERAQQAWSELPRVIRDRYQNWPAVERAAASGELQEVLKGAAGAEVLSAPVVPSASDAPPGVA